MSERKEDKIIISDEQLELLAASFYPVIRDFYKSERGKKFWEDCLCEKGAAEKEGAA